MLSSTLLDLLIGRHFLLRGHPVPKNKKSNIFFNWNQIISPFHLPFTLLPAMTRKCYLQFSFNCSISFSKSRRSQSLIFLSFKFFPLTHMPQVFIIITRSLKIRQQVKVKRTIKVITLPLFRQKKNLISIFYWLHNFIVSVFRPRK